MLGINSYRVATTTACQWPSGSKTGFNRKDPRSFPGRANLALACPLQNYVVSSASYASAFVGNWLTIIHTFLALSIHCY